MNNDLREAAEKLYLYLLQRRRYLSLKPEDIVDICHTNEAGVQEVLRFLENEGRISIWKRSKYSGCWDIKAVDNNTTSSNETLAVPIDSFVSTPTVGVGALGKELELLPKLHYLQATASVKDVFLHQDLDYQVDSCHCELEFGQKRRKITMAFNQNRPGLDFEQYSLVISKAFELIEDKLQRDVSKTEFKVIALHLSMDFLPLRLDGMNSVTLQELDGWLYRLYNKGDSLRSEAVLTSGNITLDQVEALMLSSYGEKRQLKEMLDVVRQLQNWLKQNQKPDYRKSSILTRVRSSLARI